MKSEYVAWIETWLKDNDPYGYCHDAAMAMQKEFPELKLVRGHYYCTVWGERAHWWLITEVGEVVDPTKSQFPSRGLGHYEPWDESQPEPTGMCPNCGDPCYDGMTCCTSECHNAYAAYCTNPN